MNIYQNFIGGRTKPCRSGRHFIDRNPANVRDVLGAFQRSQKTDIADAVRAAKAAFVSWSAMPAPRRGEILLRAGLILAARKEALARLMTREMGKRLEEARGDVQEAVDTAYFYAGEGRRLYGRTTPSEMRDKWCLTFRQPIGVCGLITPWNFPLAIPSWKVFPALICGNTVVLKPAEDTPLMALIFAEILAEAGLPEGVFNVVTGFGPEAGEPLLAHPDVSLLSFTGSSSVGARVAAACGSRLKRYALELGGKNALTVMEDAAIALAVDGAIWGAFATSGQRCTATSRILLHERIFERFKKLFLAKAAGLTLGAGDRPDTRLGPLINAAQLERVHRHVQKARRQGARLLLGGRRDSKGNNRYGYFYQPTVFDRVTPEMDIAREEIFGPVVALIKVRDLTDAIRVSNGSRYGLSSSIYTRDVSRALKAATAFDTGIAYINSPTIGAEAHLPFGGTKRTGSGHREAGESALDIFSEWKTVYMDASGRLQRAQIDA